MLENIRKALKGTRAAMDAHALAVAKRPCVITGVNQLETLCPGRVGDNDDAPIFIFSTAWRSGSTLLQRLVISDKRVLIWGEPYNVCGIIQRLAETAIPFQTDWPPTRYYYPGEVPPDQLKEEWIANLYPKTTDYWQGHRAFFDALFAEPARRAGAERWGIKEVRLGVEHAYYLRWIYPKARFVFLYRNPLDAYRSYVSFGRDCYYTWPDRPVFTPTAFGAHWRNLVEGFIRDGEKLGGILVRYEDIGAGDMVLQKIEQYLDIRINRGLLQKKVSGFRREKVYLGRLEKWLLRRAVSPMAEELGYLW